MTSIKQKLKNRNHFTTYLNLIKALIKPKLTNFNLYQEFIFLDLFIRQVPFEYCNAHKVICVQILQ
jgi:hypothetical protein